MLRESPVYLPSIRGQALVCVAEILETGEKWLLLTSNLSAPDQFRKPRLMSPDSCGTKAAWKLSERKACYSRAAYQTLQMEEKPYLQRRLRFAPSTTQQVSQSATAVRTTH